MADNDAVPHHEVDPANPRWVLAGRVHDVVQRRWSAEILATAVYGSMAHGDDTDSSDIDLLVVTYRSGTGPRPATRRVDGVQVELTVVTADEGLRQAAELTPRWPLVADRYLTTRALHDPRGWLVTRRDAHLARVAAARPAEFTGLARQSWSMASAAHARAVRLAEWYDTGTALLLLGEARLHAALVVGLLGRTHFRSPADAVRRTGLASADMRELGALLSRQAEELTARGHPVDGSLRSFFE
jgi:hypothetical protein